MIKKYAHVLLWMFVTAGVLASLYGLKQHSAEIGTSACNVSQTFNCDLVNKSDYSEILGFPVAGIGLVGYLMIGAVAFFYRKEKDPMVGKLLLAATVGGVLFSLYLTGIEAFVLHAWCLICLASLSSIVGALLTSYLVTREK